MKTSTKTPRTLSYVASLAMVLPALAAMLCLPACDFFSLGPGSSFQPNASQQLSGPFEAGAAIPFTIAVPESSRPHHLSISVFRSCGEGSVDLVMDGMPTQALTRSDANSVSLETSGPSEALVTGTILVVGDPTASHACADFDEELTLSVIVLAPRTEERDTTRNPSITFEEGI